jgi:hypothetical protein
MQGDAMLMTDCHPGTKYGDCRTRHARQAK